VRVLAQKEERNHHPCVWSETKKETIIPVIVAAASKHKMSSSRAMSFTNFYQNSVTVMEPAEVGSLFSFVYLKFHFLDMNT